MVSTTTNEQFDIIFAGGGTAACVTAGRLAQADPQLKILILEQGPLTKDVSDYIQPARYFGNLVKGTSFTMHQAKPSPILAGRSLIVPSGRCLGGGSSVNFAMYTRAAASDYDDWESVYQNPGWASKYLIPLIKKAETFQSDINPATHGKTGPIKVSFAEDETDVASDFLAVASQYDKGRKLTDDVNGFFECDVYGKWPRYVDAVSGRRSDTPHNYIYGRTENTKLQILERRRVVRVIFDGTRAVGVEHVSDIGRTEGVQEVVKSYAAKLVVVSAGAFGSPAILERSGIGGAEVLEKNQVTQLVDLPGVGENYMDHNTKFVPYFASDDVDTLDVIFRGTQDEVEPLETRWTKDGKGLISHNGLDAGIRFRPNEKDLKDLGPDFEDTWKNYFEGAPDKPIMFLGTLAAFVGAGPAAPRRKYFSAAVFTGYPVSRGRVHINGGLDPYAKLDFETGFLSHPADLCVLRWVYKKGREIARRMKCYRGEYAPAHPEFPKDSKATAGIASQPVDVSAPDIEYSAEDDKAIDEYYRQNVETTWHSMGTCAMKPRDKAGVVDSRLNVYGVQNLKVADCSISPANVSANTYNTALAIGEKAAVIIAQDLGIAGVSES